MTDLNAMGNNNISLHNSMTKPLLLKDRINFKCNCALVAVVSLSILYYIQSKRSNIVQMVNT